MSPTQNPSAPLDDQYEAIFVARQPIFTTEMDIWGYELLFRHSAEAGAARIDDENLATMKVIADGLTLALSGVAMDKKALINFPAALIENQSALALPKDRCVVEILETVEATDAIVDALKGIKESGYTLALDDFVGQPGFEPIIELADIVKVEILGQPREKIEAVTKALLKPGIKLLAEKIEDRETFEFCRDLGYSYFQGYFFSKPEIVPGRKIPTSSMAKIRLLKELNREDVEFEDLAKIIAMDVSLTLRLLKFVNSASFALRHEVQSIAHAISMLGIKSFKQWAMVVLMAEMDSSPRGMELAFTAMQRARFLSAVAAQIPTIDYKPDTMFLLGLFSKLDAMLNQNMADILEDIPLQEEIKTALLGGKNKARALLILLDLLDDADWDKATKLLDKFRVDIDLVANYFMESMSWANERLAETQAA